MKKFIQNAVLISLVVVSSAQSMKPNLSNEIMREKYNNVESWVRLVAPKSTFSGSILTNQKVVVEPPMISKQQPSFFQKCYSGLGAVGSWVKKNPITSAGIGLAAYCSYKAARLYFDPTVGLSSQEIAFLNNIAEITTGGSITKLIKDMPVEKLQTLAKGYCITRDVVKTNSLIGTVMSWFTHNIFGVIKNATVGGNTCEMETVNTLTNIIATSNNQMKLYSWLTSIATTVSGLSMAKIIYSMKTNYNQLQSMLKNKETLNILIDKLKEKNIVLN